jgi:hypothetical protein
MCAKRDILGAEMLGEKPQSCGFEICHAFHDPNDPLDEINVGVGAFS